MVTFNRKLPKFEYLAPKTLNEALSLLYQYKDSARVIAGGTDVLPKLRRKEIKLPDYIIDLKKISELKYIRHTERNGLALGALTTIHDVETSHIIREKFNILTQVAKSMASPQVRNRGTIVGNICNAVPSADTAPALLALKATLRILSRSNDKIVTIERFFIGPNQTILGNEEILQEVQIPELPPHSRGIYLKLTPRRAMDLALVGVAVIIIPEDDICKDIRIGLGAVAPIPMRAKGAEKIMLGQRFNEQMIQEVAYVAAEEACPIDDHRASAEYRQEMVKVLTRRAINQALFS